MLIFPQLCSTILSPIFCEVSFVACWKRNGEIGGRTIIIDNILKKKWIFAQGLISWWIESNALDANCACTILILSPSPSFAPFHSVCLLFRKVKISPNYHTTIPPLDSKMLSYHSSAEHVFFIHIFFLRAYYRIILFHLFFISHVAAVCYRFKVCISSPINQLFSSV